MNDKNNAKKEKAIELLKEMDIYAPYIKGFRENDKVCFFERFGGYWADQEPELYEKMKALEKKYNCLVYAITHEFTEFGECYSFLNRALETKMAPILILATNRGITTIRGTEYQAPHGIPLDFLDRLLIIATDPYEEKEIRQILKIRCEEEDVDMSDEALELLTTIATNTSLRYAMNMIITSSLAARKRKSNTVGKDDVGKVFKLFSDVGRSVKVLTEDKDSYLYSKVQWFVC